MRTSLLTIPTRESWPPAQPTPTDSLSADGSLSLFDCSLSENSLSTLLEHLCYTNKLRTLIVTSPSCGPQWLASLAKGLGVNASLDHIELRDVRLPTHHASALAEALRARSSLKSIGLGGSADDDYLPILRALSAPPSASRLVTDALTLWGPCPGCIDHCCQLLCEAIAAGRIRSRLTLDAIPWPADHLDRLVDALSKTSSVTTLEILDCDALGDHHRRRIAQLCQRNRDRQLLVSELPLGEAFGELDLGPVLPELRMRILTWILGGGAPDDLWSLRSLSLALNRASRERCLRVRNACHRARLEQLLERSHQLSTDDQRPEAIAMLHELVKARIDLTLAGAELLPEDVQRLDTSINKHPLAQSIHRIQNAHEQEALRRLLDDAEDFASRNTFAAGVATLEHLADMLEAAGTSKASGPLVRRAMSIAEELASRIDDGLQFARTSNNIGQSSKLLRLSTRLESFKLFFSR
jgi:hypothetical protein